MLGKIDCMAQESAQSATKAKLCPQQHMALEAGLSADLAERDSAAKADTVVCLLSIAALVQATRMRSGRRAL